jgi:acetyl-CoA C-acetyltransferase
MGSCAEACAVEHGISREAQDAFAVESYARALAAADLHAKEMVSVEIPGRRGATTVVSVDEEPAPADLAKMAKLRPAFSREANASVTAANSSKINDGGAAFILMSADEAKARGITPLARILGYADAEQEPVQFTTAPAKAVPIALERAGLAASDVHAHEINEAFSVVSLVNAQLLGLDLADVNVHGGAVAMGHPIGCSGARILGSLMTVLEARDQTVGVASICNGGGGASAVAIERI